MDRSEHMRLSCPCVPAWCVLWFTFIFFNLCSGFVDVTVGPRPGYNYSADNMWLTAWPRLEWSMPPAWSPCTVQTKNKKRRMKRERECMSGRGGGRERAVYETKTGNFRADRSLFSDGYCICSVSLVTCSLLAWLAWGHSKWPGL